MADKALRDAYGEGLVELGAKYENLFVLDADLTKSTKTATFKKAYPERFINCGIAEGNMMSVASGMASCGNIVFASSFAMFAAGRAYEQIRNAIAYPKANVKIVATHAGLTVGEDGATHQCLEDMALMRAIPGMIVISPSDAAQMRGALRFAAEHVGPVYIRAGRLAVPVIYDEETYMFRPGMSETLADGDFCTIMYTGPFYTLAFEIKKIFDSLGLSVRIVDVPSVKPMAVDAVEKAMRDTGMIVTIEDHNVYGGFGTAVADAIAECDIPRKDGVSLIKIGAQDQFGKSGTPAALMEKYGFNAMAIVKQILAKKAPEYLAKL